jgi:hypothetical protein
MARRTESALEARLAEAWMSALFPCDLGDGIEVIHDVEQIEIEMDCDLDDDAWYSTPYEKIELQLEPAVVTAFADVISRERVAALGVLSVYAFERSAVWDTLPFAPYEPSDAPGDSRAAIETVPYPRSEGDTTPFVRHPAPPGASDPP